MKKHTLKTVLFSASILCILLGSQAASAAEVVAAEIQDPEGALKRRTPCFTQQQGAMLGSFDYF